MSSVQRSALCYKNLNIVVGRYIVIYQACTEFILFLHLPGNACLGNALLLYALAQQGFQY